MAENTSDFYNWQHARTKDYVRFRKASPNLLAIADHLIKRWGGTNVGILNKRPIRGGSMPSSHTFGAALDWRYGDGDNRREIAVHQVLPWLVDNSAHLGIQAIHDYVGCKVWRSVRSVGARGWKAQPIGSEGGAMGAGWAVWLHIETTRTMWNDGSRVDERF
jgi:hypothetical protein